MPLSAMASVYHIHSLFPSVSLCKTLDILALLSYYVTDVTYKNNSTKDNRMQEAIKVTEVMKAFLESYNLTQEKFAEQITASLVNTEISRVSVTNWCNGKSSPSTDFLLLCAVVYRDWRKTWAVSCLKAKLPEVFDSGLVVFRLPKAE